MIFCVLFLRLDCIFKCQFRLCAVIHLNCASLPLSIWRMLTYALAVIVQMLLRVGSTTDRVRALTHSLNWSIMHIYMHSSWAVYIPLTVKITAFQSKPYVVIIFWSFFDEINFDLSSFVCWLSNDMNFVFFRCSNGVITINNQREKMPLRRAFACIEVIL